MSRVAVVVVGVLLLAACQTQGSKPEVGGSNLGTSAANVAMDTAVLRDANAAASEVIRSIGDCDAVKAAAPEAIRKLDELAGKVRTPAGKTTIETLRKQVVTAAEPCP